MSRKDYVKLAAIVGQTLGIALQGGGEECRNAIYEGLYEPLTEWLRADNSRFDQLRFAYAVGEAEQQVIAAVPIKTEPAMAKARARGVGLGRAAGSWAFNGNSDAETARAFLKGYEEGDPLVMDMQPSPLSGEWADGLTPQEILDDYDRTEDDIDADEILTAFEDGYAEGWWQEALLGAEAACGDRPTVTDGS